MTYTQATKDTPPACPDCGAPTKVEWVDASLDKDSAEAIGELYLPPGHPDRPLVPGHTECVARCREDGYQHPPCPHCGGASWLNWEEITEMGQREREFVMGYHECMSRCSADLSGDERKALSQQHPTWSW